jgi:hypothetical protein
LARGVYKLPLDVLDQEASMAPSRRLKLFGSFIVAVAGAVQGARHNDCAIVHAQPAFQRVITQ